MRDFDKFYYTAPPQAVFDEIKREAMKIWRTYDNTHGYVDEKIDRIRDIENVKDNWMYMVSMFDGSNQRKLLTAVSPQTKQLILQALNYPPYLPLL